MILCLTVGEMPHAHLGILPFWVEDALRRVKGRTKLSRLSPRRTLEMFFTLIQSTSGLLPYGASSSSSSLSLSLRSFAFMTTAAKLSNCHPVFFHFRHLVNDVVRRRSPYRSLHLLSFFFPWARKHRVLRRVWSSSAVGTVAAYLN